MIKDSIKNAAVYRGLHLGIDTVLASLSAVECGKWEIGRHEIQGDDVFCLIQEYETKPAGKLEAHNRYIDVQVVLDGVERIDYRDRSCLDSAGSFNNDSDIGFFKGGGDPVIVREGEFAVFFPGDGHAPGLTYGEKPGKVRKAVYKVAV